jgi:hypothetical protein
MTVSKLSARGDRALKGAQHNRARARKHSRKAIPAPILGERIEAYCETCRHRFDATYRNKYGLPEWLIGSHGKRCLRGARCLAAIAEEFGCPSAAELKRDPRPWVDPIVHRRLNSPEELPTVAQVSGWHEGLKSRPAEYRWLRVERGLSPDTIAGARLGWDPDRRAYAIPIYDADGRLVNLVRKRPGGKPIGLRGRTIANGGIQLNPQPVPRRSWLLLCAGLFDALLALQMGLPAITGWGVTTWSPKWDQYFAGRKIAVSFDVGEMAQAINRAKALRAAGARQVRVLDLEAAGLGPKEDITDWFVKYGRTADELEGLIRQAWRAQ